MPRSWTDFPPQYADLMARFDAAGQASVGPFELRTARSTRMGLYRYRDALARALKEPGAIENADLQAMAEITREFTAIVEPVSPGSDRFMIHLRRNSFTVPLPDNDPFLHVLTGTFGFPTERAVELLAACKAQGWKFTKEPTT